MRSPGRTTAAAGTLAVAAAVGGACRLGFGSRSQLFGAFPYAGSTAERQVALTFDDGPNEPWTSQILDTLADRGVPGTFFQVGRCAQRHPDVTRRVVDEGHVLGNHSLTHELGSYLRDVDQRAEVTLGRMALAEIAGVSPGSTAPRGSVTGRGSSGASHAPARTSSPARSCTHWRCSSRRSRPSWPVLSAPPLRAP